ncbi:regulator of G-protein signaling, partial [Paragonimus westermani]
PTVILTTSVTASSSSSASSLNSSISIMTMGAGNSTLTPPFTGPKRLTKPVFGACDMLDVNSKSVWPESKLDSTRCAIPGLGDSRHSASDTQLGNSCVSLARHQSPVTLSELNHEPQLRQQPRQNSEQSTHVPMAQPAAVVLQSADRQPNPLIAGNVSDPPMDTTCPGSQLKRPNKIEPNEKTCTSRGAVARQHESPNRPNRCSSFSFFKLKRTNSGHNSTRRQSESTVGLLQQNSKHRKPVDPGGKSVCLTWNSEEPTVSIDTNYDNFHLGSFQYHNMVRQSTTDGPRNRTNESTPAFLSGEQSNSKHPFTTISPTKHPPISVCDDTMDHIVEAVTGENKDSVNEEATDNLLNRPNLTATSSIVSLTTDPRSRTCCFCWCCCCSCSCMRVRASVHGSKRPSASNDPQSKMDELSVDEKLTYEEIKSWEDSFDLLMQCPGGRKVFREFLRSEYSEENILFWLACEELKQETNPELVEEKARMIYEDFISILSPREVSLDSRVREIINANMIEPTPHTFDEAQLQIYTLMHRDSYLRFLNSKMYKDLLQQTSNSLSNSTSE